MSGRRVLRGIGANAFAQFVTVVVQLGTVPALIHAWGGRTFGLWLSLIAWTSLLSLADGGVMVAGGNAMRMAFARSDVAEAARLHAGVFRFVLIVFIAVAAAASVLLPLGLPVVSGQGRFADVFTALMMCWAALASLPLGTVELGFRAQGDYATGMIGASLTRLAEAVAIVLIAESGFALVPAAAALLCVRLIGLATTGRLLRRRAPWLAQGATPSPRSGLKHLAKPALAALAVPAGLCLSLQGTTIAASLVVPVDAVATFVAARTLTRVVVQALGLVTHALMPEAAAAHGRGDIGRLAELSRLNLAAGCCLLLPGWVVLVMFGPVLVSHWTGGLLHPDPGFFAVMATAAVAHGAWLSAFNLRLAINRQSEYAFHFVLLAAATCLLAAFLGTISGLTGLALGCAAGELAMAAFVLPSQVAGSARGLRAGVASVP